MMEKSQPSARNTTCNTSKGYQETQSPLKQHTKNNLCHQLIDQQIRNDETNIDRAKKFHTSIIEMLGWASAKCSTDKCETLPTTCTRFLNSDSVGMAKYKFVHKCNGLGFPDIGFAQGTAHTLYWQFPLHQL